MFMDKEIISITNDNEHIFFKTITDFIIQSAP